MLRAPCHVPFYPFYGICTITSTHRDMVRDLEIIYRGVHSQPEEYRSDFTDQIQVGAFSERVLNLFYNDIVVWPGENSATWIISSSDACDSP